MKFRILCHASSVLLLLLPAAVHAQAGVRPVSIAGTIMDAESGEPLEYAAVTLEPAPTGALPGGTVSSVRHARLTITDSTGAYRFGDVVHGDYRLHAQRTGYRSRSVDVRVRPQSDAQVSIGLQVEPVALEPVTVMAMAARATAHSYARMAAERADLTLADAARVAAERERERLYLSSDVRVITHADVVEGVSLAETDLFRSLQRLPGIAALDEWSAELWTRGAPWDQTRIYYDGIPLFNALHALGLFAAVNTDAIGAAFLHPGVQPAGLGGAAAGALDIRSRQGTGAGELNGVGELSLASARLAFDRSATNSSYSWSVAARRSYLDLLTSAFAPAFGEDGDVPYSFSDVAARGDVAVGASSSLEVSGLITRDRLRGNVTDVVEGVRSNWGAALARATLSAPLLGLRTRHTIGYSRYASHVRESRDDDVPPLAVPMSPASRNHLGYAVVRGELESLRTGRWLAGYELARYGVTYEGQHPSMLEFGTSADSLSYDATLDVGSAWLQRRLELGGALTADIGVRMEAGKAAENRTAVSIAPRLSVRARLGSQFTASGAFGRTWQHSQALGRSGLAPIDGFASDFLWILAGDTVPALRTDVVTLGLERWIADSWIFALNGYVRRSQGLVIPDPEPGLLVDRPAFVRASGRADGLEASARRITGRWTGSVSYTYAHSRLEHADREFPAPGDQRHAIDLTVAAHVTPSWLVGLAYTAASGAPYTRLWEQTFACTDQNCEPMDPARQGEPGAERRAAYVSLDLNTERRWRFRAWQLSAFLQVRNALNWENQGRYTGAETICFARCGTPDELIVDRDTFLPALPVVPLLGVRVSF